MSQTGKVVVLKHLFVRESTSFRLVESMMTCVGVVRSGLTFVCVFGAWPQFLPFGAGCIFQLSILS